MDENLKSNLLSKQHWLRLVYMILFWLLLQVAAFVLWALVALQFLFALITGHDNAKLRAVGHSLSSFVHQSLMFLTYNSEDKPFPFSDWPQAPEFDDAADSADVEMSAENTSESSSDSTVAAEQVPVVEESAVEESADKSDVDDNDAAESDKGESEKKEP